MSAVVSVTHCSAAARGQDRSVQEGRPAGEDGEGRGVGGRAANWVRRQVPHPADDAQLRDLNVICGGHLSTTTLSRLSCTSSWVALCLLFEEAVESGAKPVADVVADPKRFSHPGHEDFVPCDLREAIGMRSPVSGEPRASAGSKRYVAARARWRRNKEPWLK